MPAEENFDSLHWSIFSVLILFLEPSTCTEKGDIALMSYIPVMLVMGQVSFAGCRLQVAGCRLQVEF